MREQEELKIIELHAQILREIKIANHCNDQTRYKPFINELGITIHEDWLKQRKCSKYLQDKYERELKEYASKVGISHEEVLDMIVIDFTKDETIKLAFRMAFEPVGVLIWDLENNKQSNKTEITNSLEKVISLSNQKNTNKELG